MERRYIILTILFAVSLILVAVGISDLNKAGKQVIVEEINSFGDRSAAEGLKLSIPVGIFEDRLQWETTVVFGEETEAASTVGFSWKAQDDRRRLAEPELAEIKISVTGNDYHSRYIYQQEVSDEEFLAEWNDLKTVYEAVSDDGGTFAPSYNSLYKETLLCLNDYYDYYPLFVEGVVTRVEGVKGVRTVFWLDGSGRWYSGYNEYETSSSFQDYGYWLETERSEDPIKNLCRGIKYRLWPEYPQNAYVRVELDSNGEKITQYGCEMVRSNGRIAQKYAPLEKPVETHAVSAVTENDIYYAVDLRVLPAGRPKAETFEEGYGVWRIGYEVVKQKKELNLTFTEAEPEMIYALDPEEMLLEITASDDQEKLYVFTAKDGMSFMTIIDLRSEQQIQKIELMSYDPEAMLSVRKVLQGGNVVVPVMTVDVWGEENGEEKLAVAAADETGAYECRFVIDRTTDMNSPAYEYQRATYWRESTLWERDLDSVELAYDNGRLAMVYSLTNSYGNDAGGWESQRPGRFWVEVYDETGVAFAADYQMSQGITEYSDEMERDGICEIRDDVEIGISWGE